MQKLVRQVLVLTLFAGAVLCGAAGAAEAPVCAVAAVAEAAAPAAEAPAALPEPLFATTVWCCLEPFPADCVAATPEQCAAAGARTFGGWGLCYRQTSECERP